MNAERGKQKLDERRLVTKTNSENWLYCERDRSLSNKKSLSDKGSILTTAKFQGTEGFKRNIMKVEEGGEEGGKEREGEGGSDINCPKTSQ